MKNLKQLDRLRRIHHLIKLQNTGTPNELAKKLRISIRLLYLLLEYLKDLDAPLVFNRQSKTYYYTHDFELKIQVSVQVMSHDKLVQIYAGSTLANYITSLQGNCSKPNYLSFLKNKLDVVG